MNVSYRKDDKLLKMIEAYLLKTREIVISCGIGEYVAEHMNDTMIINAESFSSKEYHQVIEWALKQPEIPKAYQSSHRGWFQGMDTPYKKQRRLEDANQEE